MSAAIALASMDHSRLISAFDFEGSFGTSSNRPILMNTPRHRRFSAMRFAVIIAVPIMLACCATPYQQVGTTVAGGFSSERIASNRFAVSFAGNGFTNPRRASDFALLRAAELTLEYNFRFFTLDGQRDLSHTSVAHMGSTSTTSGMVTPYGTYSGVTNTTYNDIPIFKPGTQVIITCYDSMSEDRHVGRVYDAEAVREQLRSKYRLTPSAAGATH